MGWMTAVGMCFGCGRVFSFNPERVPSYQGKPVCELCMAQANDRRQAMGLAPHPILPGAYEPEEVL